MKTKLFRAKRSLQSDLLGGRTLLAVCLGLCVMGSVHGFYVFQCLQRLIGHVQRQLLSGKAICLFVLHTVSSNLLHRSPLARICCCFSPSHLPGQHHLAGPSRSSAPPVHPSDFLHFVLGCIHVSLCCDQMHTVHRIRYMLSVAYTIRFSYFLQ